MRQISRRQVLARIATENAWWETGEIPPSLADLTPRPYLNLFLPLVAERRVRRAVVLLVYRTRLFGH